MLERSGFWQFRGFPSSRASLFVEAVQFRDSCFGFTWLVAFRPSKAFRSSFVKSRRGFAADCVEVVSEAGDRPRRSNNLGQSIAR